VSRYRGTVSFQTMLREAREESFVLRAALDAFPRERWWEQAACLGADTSAFYDAIPAGFGPVCCYECPVRIDCVAAALAEERNEFEPYGYRGVCAKVRARHKPPQMLTFVDTTSLKGRFQ
jgi:Transcription factor WhiB